MPKPEAKPKDPQPIVKIKFLQDTACETVEGQCIDVKKGESADVPKRAADYLIRTKRAETVA